MNNKRLRIGFIGGGNMARAIVSGLLDAGHDPECVYVADPGDRQQEAIRCLNSHLHVSDDNASIAEAAEIMVLAVKPQIMESATKSLKSASRPTGQLVISIAAGITLGSLQALLDQAPAVVRIMPNQPAQIGAGISALVATSETSDVQRAHAEYIGDAIGKVVWISDEALMDAVTAISGSGPAYFYLLMEIMEQCAEQMGLPKSLANALTRQTGLGTTRMASETQLPFEELRANVTSKGGTTDAAIAILEAAGIRDIVRRALRAARDRSAQLGASGAIAGEVPDSGKPIPQRND